MNDLTKIRVKVIQALKESERGYLAEGELYKRMGDLVEKNEINPDYRNGVTVYNAVQNLEIGGYIEKVNGNYQMKN